MSLFLPFNFNPGQTPTTTAGNSTIPAGKYAFVTATCEGGESLIINGTTVQTSRSESIQSQSLSASGGSGDSFVVPSGSVFEGQFYMPAFASLSILSIGGVEVARNDTTLEYHGTIKAASGATVSATSTTGSCHVTGFSRRDAQNSTASYWVFEGDDLTGTAKKTITLYDIT